jgi:hypothetical protein
VTRASPFLTGWVTGRLDALGLLIAAAIGETAGLWPGRAWPQCLSHDHGMTLPGSDHQSCNPRH